MRPWLALFFVALVTTVDTPALTDRIVDTHSARLHIRCGGDRKPGAPLVILEAGAANSADTWRDVQAPIADYARVCAYDRPGLGTSDKPAEKLSSSARVRMLHALFEKAGERPPYVFAGHSYGGMLARLYATTYPSEVAGMVLIDSSHEDQTRRFATITPSATPAATAAAAAILPEDIDLARTSAALAAAPWHASIPLVVLTRGRAGADTAPTTLERYAVWLDLHRELATRTPLAEHMVVDNSGHYIHNDQPSVVIDKIRQVVAAATR